MAVSWSSLRTFELTGLSRQDLKTLNMALNRFSPRPEGWDYSDLTPAEAEERRHLLVEIIAQALWSTRTDT